jgi:hypothetical protein
MIENFGMKIEFVRIGQGFIKNTFQFAEFYVVALNEKDKIAQVGFKTAVNLAQCNAVWVGDRHAQVAELADWNCSFLVSFWEWDEPLQWNGINVDFQFFGNLDNLTMKFVWMNIVSNEINVHGRAWTAEQDQGASTN